ncbi:gliding motility-associated C-terminal domain-containing protein, partial [Chryseobacterium sp. WG23]|nr:gliding motility-associated C-terminal domain-containing protein [Chryseobacterium sp. WG23]
ATATIRLQFHPTVVLRDAQMENCYIPDNIMFSTFDLTHADIGVPNPLPAGNVLKYYKTMNDALSQSNPIAIPDAYLSTSTIVYARVNNAQQCFAIAKITLKVLPPVKSTVLKDKVICAEGTTTLDAGPGFDGYEWSTGETTQIINNVGIGTYWV